MTVAVSIEMYRPGLLPSVDRKISVHLVKAMEGTGVEDVTQRNDSADTRVEDTVCYVQRRNCHGDLRTASLASHPAHQG